VRACNCLHTVGIAQRPEDRYEFGKIASATEKIYNRIPGQADWLYDEQMSFIEEKKPPKQRKEENKGTQEDWNLLRTEERRELKLIDGLQEDLHRQLKGDLESKDDAEKQKEERNLNPEPSLSKPQLDPQVKDGGIEVKREWRPYGAKEAQGSQSKRRMTDSRPRKESLAHTAGRPDSPGAPSIKTLRSPAPLKAESANSVECVIS